MMILADALLGLSILALTQATVLGWRNRTHLDELDLYKGFFRVVAGYLTASGALLIYLMNDLVRYPGTFMAWGLVLFGVALQIAYIVFRQKQFDRQQHAWYVHLDPDYPGKAP